LLLECKLTDSQTSVFVGSFQLIVDVLGTQDVIDTQFTILGCFVVSLPLDLGNLINDGVSDLKIVEMFVDDVTGGLLFDSMQHLLVVGLRWPVK